MLELVTLPPFAKCAKDGAPNYLWLVEMSRNRMGHPPFYLISYYGRKAIMAENQR